MTRRLAREDREALYQAVRSDLRFIGAIGDALGDRRLRTAEMLGARYRAELRLLDDLGWLPEDEREQFELTLPDDQLARALLRLINHMTLTALDQPRRRGMDDPAWRARYQRISRIATDLLPQLPPDLVASASEPLPEGWPQQ